MRNLPESAPYAPGNEASMQAAKSIAHQLTGIRAAVFDLIVSSGGEGATGDEISKALGKGWNTVKPRCSELKTYGFIVDSGMMRKNLGGQGNDETVWVAAKAWPTVTWKELTGSDQDDDEQRPSGLSVFDGVFRRNPHLRNTFSFDQIQTIREDLKKAEGVA